MYVSPLNINLVHTNKSFGMAHRQTNKIDALDPELRPWGLFFNAGAVKHSTDKEMESSLSRLLQS